MQADDQVCFLRSLSDRKQSILNGSFNIIITNVAMNIQFCRTKKLARTSVSIQKPRFVLFLEYTLSFKDWEKERAVERRRVFIDGKRE